MHWILELFQNYKYFHLSLRKIEQWIKKFKRKQPFPRLKRELEKTTKTVINNKYFRFYYDSKTLRIGF